MYIHNMYVCITLCSSWECMYNNDVPLGLHSNLIVNNANYGLNHKLKFTDKCLEVIML